MSGDMSVTNNRTNTLALSKGPAPESKKKDPTPEFARRFAYKGSYTHIPFFMEGKNIEFQRGFNLEVSFKASAGSKNNEPYESKIIGGIKSLRVPGSAYEGEVLDVLEPYIGYRKSIGEIYHPLGKGMEFNIFFRKPMYIEKALYISDDPTKASALDLAKMNASVWEMDIKGVFRFTKDITSPLRSFGAYAGGKMSIFSAYSGDVSANYFKRFPSYKEISNGVYDFNRDPRDLAGLSFALEGGLKYGGVSLGLEYAQDRQKDYYPLYQDTQHYDSWALTGGLDLNESLNQIYRGFSMTLKPKWTFWTTEIDTADMYDAKAYENKFEMYYKFGFKGGGSPVEFFMDGIISSTYPSSFGIGLQIKRD